MPCSLCPRWPQLSASRRMQRSGYSFWTLRSIGSARTGASVAIVLAAVKVLSVSAMPWRLPRTSMTLGPSFRRTHSCWTTSTDTIHPTPLSVCHAVHSGRRRTNVAVCISVLLTISAVYVVDTCAGMYRRRAAC